MKLAMCVDDTDDLTKTTSTGKVARELEKLFKKLSLLKQEFSGSRNNR